MTTDVTPFELRDSDHTDLFGIFLAVHAVPGAVMFLHTTVGCKFKTQLHLVDHDWFRESHNQRLWTGVDDIRLIQGSGEQLLRFAETWYERRHPTLAVVTTNAAVELSSLDVDSAVADLQDRLPCPVILLKAPGYEGNLHRGYRRMVSAVASLVDWSKEPEEGSVALVGYLFDRFEMDHAANLNELKRLLARLGIRLRGTLFSGEGLEQIREISRAKTLLLLPYAHGLEPELRELTGRRTALLDLPVGLRGTSTFLREVGAAVGLDRDRVESLIDEELGRAVPLLSHVSRVLTGRHQVVVSLFLDTPMAASVGAFLAEMGAHIPLVALTDGEEADAEVFTAALERLEAPLASPPRVLEGPSHEASLRAFEDLRGWNEIHVVVGSSHQRQALAPLGARVVELGYPSNAKHQVYPVPWMGYTGAVGLAQRVMDAAHAVF